MKRIGNFFCLRVSELPAVIDSAAKWFSERWGLPEETYLRSMTVSLTSDVPSWYVCMDGDKILAGMGVIENDFHDRKDLTPNVCAVYTDPEYRGRGIAGSLIGYVCDDMAAADIDTLYLLTDHSGLYERWGWSYLCTAMGDGEDRPSRVYVHHT